MALFADLWPQMGLKLNSNPQFIPILYFWFCAVSEYVIHYSKYIPFTLYSRKHTRNNPASANVPNLLEDPPFIIGCVSLIFPLYNPTETSIYSWLSHISYDFPVKTFIYGRCFLIFPYFPMNFPATPLFLADGPAFFPIFSRFSHRHVYQSTWFLRSRAAAVAAMAPVVLPATATSTRCCVGEWFALVSWLTETNDV